jgi:hypothetical protein
MNMNMNMIMFKERNKNVKMKEKNLKMKKKILCNRVHHVPKSKLAFSQSKPWHRILSPEAG